MVTMKQFPTSPKQIFLTDTQQEYLNKQHPNTSNMNLNTASNNTNNLISTLFINSTNNMKENQTLADPKLNTSLITEYPPLNLIKNNIFEHQYPHPRTTLPTQMNLVKNQSQAHKTKNTSYVAQPVLKSNDNGQLQTNISTIGATFSKRQSYLQVATTELHRRYQNKSPPHRQNAIFVKTIQSSKQHNSKGRLKATRSTGTRHTIVTCRLRKHQVFQPTCKCPKQKAIQQAIQSTKPNPAISEDYISKYIEQLANIPTIALPKYNNIRVSNYFSSLFDDDDEEEEDKDEVFDISIFEMTSNREENGQGDESPTPPRVLNSKYLVPWDTMQETQIALEQDIETEDPDTTDVNHNNEGTENETENFRGWQIHTNHRSRNQGNNDPYGKMFPNISPVYIHKPPKTPPMAAVEPQFRQPLMLYVLGPLLWETMKPKPLIAVHKPNRLLLAFLHCAQKIDPEARLSKIFEDDTATDILSEADIPQDEESEQSYIFNCKVKGNRFQGQIVLKSNIHINTLKEHPIFHNWITSERIGIVKQRNSGTILIDIGFFTQVLNRGQMDIHQTECLKKWLHPDTPSFQLTTKTLDNQKSNKSHRIRVLYLQCAEKDQQVIEQEIERHVSLQWTYFNAKTFEGFSPEERSKAIKNHGDYHKANHNFLLTTFHPDSEQVPVHYLVAKRKLSVDEDTATQDHTKAHAEANDQEMKEDNDMLDDNITEYLLNYFLDANREPLFLRLGPIVDGAREATIKQCNAYRKDYLNNTILGQLYAMMTDDAAILCFDIEIAKLQIIYANNPNTKCMSPSEYAKSKNIVVTAKPAESAKRARSEDTAPAQVTYAPPARTSAAQPPVAAPYNPSATPQPTIAQIPWGTPIGTIVTNSNGNAPTPLSTSTANSTTASLLGQEQLDQIFKKAKEENEKSDADLRQQLAEQQKVIDQLTASMTFQEMQIETIQVLVKTNQETNNTNFRTQNDTLSRKLDHGHHVLKTDMEKMMDMMRMWSATNGKQPWSDPNGLNNPTPPPNPTPHTGDTMQVDAPHE